MMHNANMCRRIAAGVCMTQYKLSFEKRVKYIENLSKSLEIEDTAHIENLSNREEVYKCIKAFYNQADIKIKVLHDPINQKLTVQQVKEGQVMQSVCILENTIRVNSNQFL